MGILWSFFHPIFMLAVYTFVFSVAFKARWNTGTGSNGEFAMVLFSGLLVFNLFAECVGRAPSLIVANANQVKRVVFPLEILACVALGSALFHMAMSFAVWLGFYLVLFGLPHATILYFPLLLMPLSLITMGFSWLLASLGVYLRDVAQVVGIVTTSLLFMTPIFYPISVVPEKYRPILYANPLTVVVERVRDALIWGKAPDWLEFSVFAALAALVCWLGFAWFQKTRKGFADVL